ncbi:MAG: hypothetical protein DME26_14590 [Verrucomicrobia bacterium]|nr:MAG: hypothetical protein DME26_14590 [Verrucomicrobiota bacterium]
MGSRAAVSRAGRFAFRRTRDRCGPNPVAENRCALLEAPIDLSELFLAWRDTRSQIIGTDRTCGRQSLFPGGPCRSRRCRRAGAGDLSNHRQARVGRCKRALFARIDFGPSLDRQSPLVPARLKALRPSAAIIEADDTIRRALADCVNQHSSFSCNPGFAGTQEGFREFRDRAPRLVLINRLLTTGARIESSAQLSKLPTEMPKLVYSVYEDSDQLFKATPGGASGYLLKRTTPDKLLEPIARLASGENFSPKLISFHIRQYFREVIDSLPTVETSPDLAKLTQREQEILNLLSKGYVDKEIADALRISIWTVHGHMKNIFEKLDVHTRTEAVVKYLHK